MFKNVWTQGQAQAVVLRASLEKQTAKIDEQIEGLLDRIVEASKSSVIAPYEARIGKLEQEKLVRTEKLDNYASPRHSFEELFELAFEFLPTPWKLWDSGQLTLKHTVLRLAFCERVAYCRKEGLRTPKKALPFKLLTGLEMSDLEMARPGGFEPPTS